MTHVGGSQQSPAVLKLSIATALASIALGATALGATGDLNPQGCIDDADTGTDNGVLILRGCIQDDAGPGPCEESVDGLNAPTSVTVSPAGDPVYVGGTGDDAVVRFNRNTTSGGLTPKGCVDDDTGLDNCAQTTDGLDGAAGVAVSPDGASLYAVSVVDEAIVRFARDPG